MTLPRTHDDPAGAKPSSWSVGARLHPSHRVVFLLSQSDSGRVYDQAMLHGTAYSTIGGIPDTATVAHYDADRHLVGQVMHVDGEFVIPPTLEPGESLWLLVPGRTLLPLVVA